MFRKECAFTDRLFLSLCSFWPCIRSRQMYLIDVRLKTNTTKNFSTNSPITFDTSLVSAPSYLVSSRVSGWGLGQRILLLLASRVVTCCSSTLLWSALAVVVVDWINIIILFYCYPLYSIQIQLDTICNSG